MFLSSCYQARDVIPDVFACLHIHLFLFNIELRELAGHLQLASDKTA